MADKKVNRYVAFGVFLVSAFIYLKTLSVTVVFWDVGEFCAASWLLQIPHPPGSPLFVLVARIASMIPFYADIARRMHTVSAIGSAVGVMLLYLVCVRIIERFRGVASTFIDRIIVYGSSAIGALAMAWCPTYWDNSIEAEVYGLSMMFVALIIWISFLWSDRAHEPRNERYIILIAYLVGLSIGVHLLSLLALFTVAMFIYFKLYEYTWRKFIKFCVIAIPAFFIVYPGIVQWLPGMLGGNFAGTTTGFWTFVAVAVTAVVAYFAYHSVKMKKKWLNVAALSFLFIILGYTTYVEVLIRSNVRPPMNENDPSNLERLVSYLSREQYGDTPLLRGPSWNNDLGDFEDKYFPRRYSNEVMHEPTRANYTSDWDFLWRYQIVHMFLRYLGQNYIGEEGDWQDAGISWTQTWGIPFLIGLFGIYYHWKKDWRNWLPFLAMFMVMGLAFDLYANMQEPQPRERDYFYVGAIYAFCVWIAIGMVGIIDLIKENWKNRETFQSVAVGCVTFGVLAVPLNLMRVNYHEHDRSKNYVAWDYSYNLLQSCDQDAILFTNGDNDTFPLWYLQDVENIRTDVRIVNLSLINTPWYILQLKHETPHGTAKVPISLSDAEIEGIRPRQWKPQTEYIPVPKYVQDEFGVTDSTIIQTGKLAFTMAGVSIGQNYSIERVQDILVQNIILMNNWQRPIDFAVTCSPDSKIGLDDYMWMQGLTYRLKPIKATAAEGGINGDMMEQSVFNEITVPSKTYRRGALYRNLNDTTVYYDENIQRMVMNYRAGFLQLADYEVREKNNPAKARQVLDKMERVIPLRVIPNRDWRYTYRMMSASRLAEDTTRTNRYSSMLEREVKAEIATAPTDQRELSDLYSVLLNVYETRKDYTSAIDMLTKLQEQYPDDQRIKNQIQIYQNMMNAQQASSDTTTK
jgi:hypothetical protein